MEDAWEEFVSVAKRHNGQYRDRTAGSAGRVSWRFASSRGVRFVETLQHPIVERLDRSPEDFELPIHPEVWAAWARYSATINNK